MFAYFSSDRWHAHRRTIRQILKEFALPFTIAVVWTIYNWSQQPSSSITTLINLFAPTFFFAAWVIGQWIRVKKQTRAEDSFADLKQQAEALLERIDVRVNDVIDTYTGGDSYCYLAPVRGYKHFVIFHHGKHVLYDVRVSIKDQLEFHRENISQTADLFGGIHVVWATVMPNIAAYTREIPYPSTENRVWISWDIHFTSRNGRFFQVLRWAKVGNEWYRALRVSRDGSILYESIDKDFPLVNGGVDWRRFE